MLSIQKKKNVRNLSFVYRLSRKILYTYPKTGHTELILHQTCSENLFLLVMGFKTFIEICTERKEGDISQLFSSRRHTFAKTSAKIAG